MDRQFTALVLDMDGVIYRGDVALPGAVELFPALRAAGISVILATNNATLSEVEFTAKLARMGIEVPPEWIVTSAGATAAWLAEQAPDGARLYAIGTASLRATLLAVPGMVWDEQQPEYVVVGLDPGLTYDKLRIAAVALGRGARFVATNPDLSLPKEGGEVWPGAGAIQAALTATTGRAPDIILGKPEPALYHLARTRLGSDPAHTLAVGDRADTDILGGRRAGLATALVLTGVTQAGELPLLPPEQQPDYVYWDLGALTQALTRG